MSEFLSLRDAIARLVRPGHSVALEGFTHLIPFAAGHEIIRQRLTDLTLIRMTPDLIYDQMIGCGCAKKLVFSWGGNPGVGSLHRLRDAIERGWPRSLELEVRSDVRHVFAIASIDEGEASADARIDFTAHDGAGGRREEELRSLRGIQPGVVNTLRGSSEAMLDAQRNDFAIFHRRPFLDFVEVRSSS
jgi:acyl CoA:acetate/3-ketoacid CoA transferase alpha subunit